MTANPARSGVLFHNRLHTPKSCSALTDDLWKVHDEIAGTMYLYYDYADKYLSISWKQLADYQQLPK